MTRGKAPLAPRIAALAQELTGQPLAFGLRAYDGSQAGPAGPPALEIATPVALRRMIWNPGELGIADAYVAGDLQVHGDLLSLLRLLHGSTAGRRTAAGPTGAARPAAGRLGRPPVRSLAAAARLALGAGALGPRPPVPAARARVRGRQHSRARDRAVVAHHYDLSNDFYQLLLDPAMCYSCGYWSSAEPGYGLAGAQRDKLDLVCRKLGLAQGARLLDLGCGWGSLVQHAAEHYGAKVTGVTLSAQQARYARQRITSAGLDGRAEIRLTDYRDISDGPYDAISVIEMGEHVGAARYPAFAAQLAGLLAPRARLLVQQMSRGGRAPDGGPFIASYIAPDMHMRPLPRTLALLQAAGLEIVGVEGMREHYALTFQAWRETLDLRFAQVQALLGPQGARVWRMFLAAGGLSFERGTTGVDQIVATRR
ncbi:MAG TPA: cyclopropane-fatty-acyl-phospholipid synthase family protein [Trebonia sp.]|nr:cyclopropane-fatty-acyl-phospholipid synthase family protein [Trebonia sp.]